MLEFKINNNIPLKEIHSSMQLDSGQQIASLKAGDWKLSLEVRGEVRVLWNPDPSGDASDGQVYRSASQFPDELMEVFAKGYDTNGMPNIVIDDNNWFELFVDHKGKNIGCDVVVDEDLDPVKVFKYMLDTYLEYKAYEERPKGQPGTLIHGTLRNEDLIPAFKRLFFSLDKSRCRDFMNANDNLLKALCDLECHIENDWWESEEATFICDELNDILNGYAPEGHYFGAHPGDGSDFGFWPIDDC